MSFGSLIDEHEASGPVMCVDPFYFIEVFQREKDRRWGILCGGQTLIKEVYRNGFEKLESLESQSLKG